MKPTTKTTLRVTADSADDVGMETDTDGDCNDIEFSRLDAVFLDDDHQQTVESTVTNYNALTRQHFPYRGL